MSVATLLFPPEIFVDQVLVTVRDAQVHIPGSTVPFHQHARQAASLAERAALPDHMIAAALLYGVGELMVRSWSRHPAFEHAPSDPIDAAVAHLGSHLPDRVLTPIRLLPAARRYLDAGAAGLTATAPQRRFETELQAADAVELALIDRRAGLRHMITPKLDHYRDLLRDLCIEHEVSPPI
ncbi:MAG: hypothetical protein AAF480_17975 [Actinomycetota bacterium]